MPQIFVCKGCETTCYYSTIGEGVESKDIPCPRYRLQIAPTWREIQECEG